MWSGQFATMIPHVARQCKRSLVGTYHSPSLEDSVLGSYQLQCPFVQWLPYSCDVADTIDEEAPEYESAFRLITGP